MTKGCDCIHAWAVHDSLTGACLYINPIHGPCPCRATPESTRKALEAAHLQGKKVEEEAARLGRRKP